MCGGKCGFVGDDGQAGAEVLKEEEQRERERNNEWRWEYKERRAQGNR